MTPPNLPRSEMPDLPFPRTREEAEQVMDRIQNHCRSQGCRCSRLKVEFIQPRIKNEKPYICVEHERLCLLAYGPGSMS